VTSIENPRWRTPLGPADITILTDDELDSIAGGAHFAMGGIAPGPWHAPGQEWDDAPATPDGRMGHEATP
jgi:hypothetical protein